MKPVSNKLYRFDRGDLRRLIWVTHVTWSETSGGWITYGHIYRSDMVKLYFRREMHASTHVADYRLGQATEEDKQIFKAELLKRVV